MVMLFLVLLWVFVVSLFVVMFMMDWHFMLVMFG